MKNRIAFSVFLLIFSTLSSANNITNFDSEILKSLGIDPEVSIQLAMKPRFLAGEQIVNFYVNNEYKGREKIMINTEGEPCLNVNLLKKIGLTPPYLFRKREDCFSLESIWENSDIVAKTTEQALWLFVPEEAINRQYRQSDDYIYGGNGGVLNYSAHYMGSSGRERQNLYFLNTEVGVNSNNWLFRSAQMYNRVSENMYRHQYAYVQTTLEKQQKNMRVGQISLQNNIVGAARVLGIQFSPETRLEGSVYNGAVVSGVATESSMVEIYQSGQLIHQTAVPPGAFEISQFSLLNRTSDLEVKLNGVNGQIQTFKVPASMFLVSSSLGSRGYTFGIGRYDENSARSHPWVASISKGWALSPYLSIDTGGTATDQYYAAGVVVSPSLSPDWLLSVANNVSHSKNENVTGAILTTNIAYMWNDNLSLGINGLLQTANYRYLNDTVNASDNKNMGYKQRQLGGSLNWSLDTIGAINLSLGRSYNGQEHAQDYISSSWSKTLNGRYTVNTTFQRSYTQDNNPEDTLFVRLSIPLEKANFSSWLSNVSHHNRVGSRYQSYGDRDQNWGVGYEYDQYQHYQSVSANINQITPYTQLGGNIRRSNDQQMDWGASLTGGVAIVKEGMLFSAYSIKDTFGVAKAGERRGLRLETNAGTAWTNDNGYALLPSLESYRNNGINVDTRTLKRQYDILNAYKSVRPAKGSVVPVTFSVIESRRLMMNVTLDGTPLPIDSIVNDDGGNFLTLATREGQIFLGNAIPDMTLYVMTPHKKHCMIKLDLPQQIAAGMLYEKANVSCTPI